MQFIPLTQGLFARVDDCWFEELNQYKWYALKGNDTYYAVRNIVTSEGNRRGLRMHRVIMNASKGVLIDHKDRNGLHNEEANLRNCNKSQNSMNHKLLVNSKYTGVSYNGPHIRARIWVNGVQKHLGYFSTEELAARAHDKAAKLYHGEFATLNFSEK